MALRLGDVERNHKKREEVRVSTETPTLRPWQGLEQRDDLRRVRKSEIAISKAREIAKRNHEMVMELRQGYVPGHVSAELERQLLERESAFYQAGQENAWGQRVSLKKGFFSFFKDVFRPTELS